MKNELKFKIGSFILGLLLCCTLVLAMYFGTKYIHISFEIAKNEPLDTMDKICIACVSGILFLIVFCFIYQAFLRLKNWD